MKTVTQFNPMTNNAFSGSNLEACLAAKSEHGYKSNKWITYHQAAQLGIYPKRGTGVRLTRFGKDSNGESRMFKYNVFNTDVLEGLPKEILNAKPPRQKAQKATKSVTNGKGKGKAKNASRTDSAQSQKANPSQETTNAALISALQGIMDRLDRLEQAA